MATTSPCAIVILIPRKAGTRTRPSTYVLYRSRDPAYKATTNNQLLVSIAQAFGVNLKPFGTQPDTASTTGPLTGAAFDCAEGRGSGPGTRLKRRIEDVGQSLIAV